MKARIQQPTSPALPRTPCCASLPEHQIRYARAWMLHQDDGMSDEAKRACEREMDDAQNRFSFAEFQAFKLTLPGFVEFWRDSTSDVTGG